MKKKERNVLNNAINSIAPLVGAYNVTDWSIEATNFSIVVDAVLEVADRFIPESKAGEVIDEIIKARDTAIMRRRKCRSLKYRINHE